MTLEMRILIFLSFLLEMTKQELKIPYMDSLFVEVPHYDTNFQTYQCNNIKFQKWQWVDPLLVICQNRSLINEMSKEWKIDYNKY